MKKRITSWLLCLAILLPLLPSAALAAETLPPQAQAQETEASALPDAGITVPSGAELFVGSKTKHYVPFTEMEPAGAIENGDGTTTYYFDLTDGGTYNYRVGGREYVTYAGIFQKTADYQMTVTEEQLQPEGKSKSTVDHDVTANDGRNVADIYLNIDSRGYLKLDRINDTYQLVNLRNWEAVDSDINNYFIEPDYHYTVIDESGDPSGDVVTVSGSGLITAVGEGTAIVLVSYDAIDVVSANVGPFFGAIWPENTGVFVVSVGAGDSGIDTGMTINNGKNDPELKLSGDAIDAEHDVIYFTGDEGSYTFTPGTEDCTVSTANPTVADTMAFTGFVSTAANSDGSFTVPLTEGRNIVKIEKGSKAEYQVITAKKVEITVNGGKPVVAGEDVSVVFDTVFHPANKLAGVYNMNAFIAYQTPDGKLAGSTSKQYTVASTAAAQTMDASLERTTNSWGAVSYKKTGSLTIPMEQNGNYVLTGGALVAVGWGDPYGNHRGITLTDGKAPNLNASVKEAKLGSLPDVAIPVTTLDSISVETQPSRVAYSLGDSFDPAGMVVKANYGDGRSAEITDYTFAAEPFAASGEQAVTIRYTQGSTEVTAEVKVNVSEAVLDRIEVTAQPAKTTYQVNEEFDPAGMEVTAHYSDGTDAVVSQYTLSHGKLISTDKEVTVTYNGKTAAVPVSVTGLKLNQISISRQPNKTSYIVGQVFDPTGIQVTAAYNDRTTADVTDKVAYEGTQFDEVTDNHYITVSYTENGVTKTAYQKVAVKTAEEGSVPAETITVQFTLLGDSAHGEGEVHTLKAGNLETWIRKTDVTVPKGSKVVDVVARALGRAGIPYENPTGNYITSVRGIGEFTNGDCSGWMYTRNGRHPDLGVAEQTVKNGDVIVFHYTDDYTQEQGSESWGGSVGGKAEETQAKLPFTDVDGHWALDAIRYVYESNLFSGTTTTTFSPDATMTRAMLAQVLYRLAGSPAVTETAVFTDVATDSWCADAVAWASTNGIVAGYGDGRFGAQNTITREQMAAMLYRYAQSKGEGFQGQWAFRLEYTDAEELSDYAREAMCWCTMKGIITGKGENILDPKGDATRAQVAAILMRFSESIAKK